MRYLYPLYSILLSVMFLPVAYAQNMVVNGNFETYSTCPTSAAQLVNCIGWRPYHTGSPDYFSSCASATATGVPVSLVGYQTAASGNSFTGIAVYHNASGFKEYITREITPLIIGKKYEVSISVNLSEIAGYSTTDLGVWFYDNGPATSLSTSGPIPVTPQVSYTSLGAVTDTVNWVRLSGTFVADSAYDNIVIGGFGSATSSGQVSTGFGSSYFTNYAYYFIDSVEVRPLSSVKINYTDTIICAADTIYVPYDTSGVVFNSGNTFTLQLSDASGSFTSAVNIGSVATTTNDTIKGIIPASTATGTGYKLRIISSSPADTDVIRFPISIGNMSPIISVSANTPICSGQTLYLTTTSTSGITCKWSGPAFSSTLQSPSLSNAPASASGTYVVKASVYGCTSTDSIAVTVNQSPTPIIAGIVGNGGCEPLTFSISSSNSITGAGYSWTGPNGYSSVLQYDTIKNAALIAAGKYYVSATTGNGCYTKDSITVTIKPLPHGFIASSNSPVCQGSQLNLSAFTTSSGVSFNWNGPSGYTSSTPAPSIANAQPALSGRYRISADLNGCNITDTITVLVVPIPAIPIPSANNPVCIGQPLNLNAGSTGPGYLWTGPGGFSSTLQTPTIPNATTPVAGVYSVKVIDGACVSAVANVTVNVVAAPDIKMYPSPKDSICVGTMVTFFSSASNAGNGATYKWFKNQVQAAGATSISYATIPTADYDEFFCTVTSNGTCGTPFTDTSNSIVMRVFPWLPASVSIAATPNTPTVGGDLITFNATPVNGGNAPTYQWKRNKKDVVGALSNTWGAKNLDNKDVICVVMNSSYLCPQPKSANSNCITVDINTTGVDRNKLLNGISIYPNPVNNELVIDGISKETRIQLFDVLGRIVIDATAASQKELINTSALIKGNYILQLTDKNGKRLNAKIVKD